MFGKALCKEFNITEYPSLYFFPSVDDDNGKYFKYEGDMTIFSIEKFSLGRKYKNAV